MSLDDYSLTKTERIFFEKATIMIYEWLSDEEKLALNIELRGERVRGIYDLEIKDRFFRLLNFLEVKYTRVEEWIKRIFQGIEEINAVSLSDATIRDIEIKRFEDKTLRLSNVASKLLDSDLKDYFFATLKKMELERGYKGYLTKLEGMPNE